MFEVQIYSNHAYRKAARFESVNRCSAFVQGNHQNKPGMGLFRVMNSKGKVQLSGRILANGKVQFN
jgi:hypothetical protein